jgi:flagellar export protein FliJ
VSRERVARLQRVLDARAAVAGRLELELTGCTQVVQQAQRDVDRARQDWFDAMNVVPAESCSSADLADIHAYAATLRCRYDVRARELQEAIGRREECHERLCAARIEVRKLELWRDRLIEGDEREEAARERRATDELAARLVRTE